MLFMVDPSFKCFSRFGDGTGMCFHSDSHTHHSLLVTAGGLHLMSYVIFIRTERAALNLIIQGIMTIKTFCSILIRKLEQQTRSQQIRGHLSSVSSVFKQKHREMRLSQTKLLFSPGQLPKVTGCTEKKKSTNIKGPLKLINKEVV